MPTSILQLQPQQLSKDLVVLAVPYRMHTILTDNGIQFFSCLLKKPSANKIHAFSQVVQQYDIKHKLTKVKHPWTTERMNSTLKQATVKTYHYDTLTQLKEHLFHFLNAYNYTKKLKTIQFLTPMEKIIKEFQLKPELLHSNPLHYFMGLNT